LNRSDAGIHAALMITMVVWGLNLPLVKALTQWFDAQQIATLRMLVACTTYVGLMAWKHGRWPRFTPRQWVGLALCALCMVYGNQMLFATGMARTGAANAALVMATAPIVSGLLAAAAFGEAITRRQWVGVALGFAGVATVVLHRPGAVLQGGGLGEVLLLGCVLAYGLGGVLVQRLSPRIDALALSTVIYLIGTSLLLLQLLATQGSTLTVERFFPGWWPWALVVFSGVTATALCNWVWNLAIARIGMARTAVYVYWVPVFGMGFAALLLGEPLNIWYGVGLALVWAGARLAARRAAVA
jgi:drug/metabolite transporter (DMT)-like permease